MEILSTLRLTAQSFGKLVYSIILTVAFPATWWPGGTQTGPAVPRGLWLKRNGRMLRLQGTAGRECQVGVAPVPDREKVRVVR